MKKNSLILLFILAAFSIRCYLSFRTPPAVEVQACIDLPFEEFQEESQLITLERESITFILGEDKDAKNPYYAEAKNYYTLNPKARTEYLVDTCRSLKAVRDYLDQQRPSNGLPWGCVNLVLHSNEWSGLGVAVLPDGKRATNGSITRAMEEELLLPLSNEVLDEESQLIFYGCAMGKNEELLKTLAHAFGGEDRLPFVASSRYFVFYQSQKHNGQTVSSERYLTDYHYAFFKTGYRSGDIRLSNQLKKNYPESTINWRDALLRTAPRWPGDVYHYTFKVPVVWTVTYASETERPKLKTEKEKMEWLQSQQELQTALNQYGIPKDKYQWTINRIQYTFDDGSKEPAIKAIGFCTILCVLQALVEKDTHGNIIPIKMAINDETLFGIYDTHSPPQSLIQN